MQILILAVSKTAMLRNINYNPFNGALSSFVCAFAS